MKGKKNISVTIKENKASDAKRENVCIYNYCKYICKLHNSMKVVFVVIVSIFISYIIL